MSLFKLKNKLKYTQRDRENLINNITESKPFKFSKAELKENREAYDKLSDAEIAKLYSVATLVETAYLKQLWFEMYGMHYPKRPKDSKSK